MAGLGEQNTFGGRADLELLADGAVGGYGVGTAYQNGQYAAHVCGLEVLVGGAGHVVLVGGAGHEGLVGGAVLGTNTVLQGWLMDERASQKK